VIRNIIVDIKCEGIISLRLSHKVSPRLMKLFFIVDLAAGIKCFIIMLSESVLQEYQGCGFESRFGKNKIYFQLKI